MAIPQFQEAMKPVLEFLSRNNESHTSEIRNYVASVFKTTNEEMEELLPSKRAKLFYNRVAWAIQYLKMAELIESEKRSYYKITNAGKNYLPNSPSNITIQELSKFEAFKLKKESTEKSESIQEIQTFSTQTPEEMIQTGYNIILSDLSSELLKLLKTSSPYFFEFIVVDLLIKMGYGDKNDPNAILTKKSGDEGVDGIIKEDKLGLEFIYVQAKRWENPVGRQEIQKFAGALQGQRAKKGVFITTSRFSSDAVEYVNKIESRIILIDGNELTKLMIEYGVGVSEKENYIIKKIDTDYFVEE